MAHRSALVSHPGFLAYDFGPTHPLRPERITAGLDLLRAVDLLDDRDLLEPSAATIEDLALVHDVDYVEAVRDWKTLPPGTLYQYGLTHGDNPPFPGIHESASLVAGGSLEAIRRIMRGELDHAFNPAGGLHHAGRALAAGFCVYNDPALAAAEAVNAGMRVLYLDFDAHHGDGVQWIFYDSPQVMTVSFHETGLTLFPGTGHLDETGKGAGQGFALNVPVLPDTRDDEWTAAVSAVAPAVAERFRPDLIISAHGADTHRWDPLTHLSLTTRSFQEQARVAHELAHTYAAGRWLAVGSGGYDWRHVVPRSWAILWAEMSEGVLPQRLPTQWQERWAVPFARFFDAESLPGPADESTARANAETLHRVLDLKLPPNS